MIRRIWFGVAGGILGGALVGLAEALFILSSASTGESVALLYAAVLYGILGALIGAGLGLGLAVLGRLWSGLSDAVAWCLGFLGVFSAFGFVIARYIVNKVVYLEQGVPMKATLAIVGSFGLISALGLWLGSALLTRTRLRGLLKPAGTFGAYALLVAVAAGFSFAPTGGSPEGEMAPKREQPPELLRQPHVILIMVDTLRADHLGAYGASPDASPNLDALARDGVVFENAFSSASWTRASTASLMTSMAPSSHSTEVKVAVLPDEVVTLAEVMQARGYITGGLPNNINVSRSFNFQQGFDWFSYQAPSYIAGATESASQLSMYNVVRKVRDRLDGGKKRVEDYYQPAEVVFPHAEEFISANDRRAWFLWVHLMEPHDPYFEHPYDGKAYGRAEHERPDLDQLDYLKETYAGEIQYMDVRVGEFIAWLKEKDLYDNTVIVVTADHGEEFQEHGGWWHGTTLYDEQIHVPMIIKLPGQQWAGTRVPWQVRQNDIAPTLASLAEAPAPPSWQGKDVFEPGFADAVAAFQPAPAPDPTANPAEGEAPEEATVPVDTTAILNAWSRVLLAEEDFEGNVLHGVRALGWKYVTANEGNPRGLQPEEMYNEATDPAEKANLAGKGDPKQTELSGLLRDERDAAAKDSVKGKTTEISNADCQRLLQLGYVDKCD